MNFKHDIRRLAILNRGEAAMRCIRAVKALRTLEGSDLEAIALYTAVDRDAPFVRHADRSVRLAVTAGGSAVAPYLDHDGLLAALAEAGADAVWPGWGFVAEDPEFVAKVEAAGLQFLGPPAAVMRRLGDKVAAKDFAQGVGVPVIPWSGGPAASVEAARAAALKIGFPLMVKASAGGGGRGIRAVDSPDELAAAFESASAEGRAAFGDPTVFLEKRLRAGRHVEVQVAADTLGQVLAFGCRDCSVQRRHQKVLEEAPPPGLTAEFIAAIENAAVALVSKCGYRGVGTVEFLVADGRFYFLEVNPRLQVEHGITEEITGVDLVQLQIRIARGEALPERPADSGRVAIEARVCAEDPEAEFLPAPGEIEVFDPALGPRVRVDSGVAAGCPVPPDFDSLIAKVIASGDSREEARARLACALTDFELVVVGGATNKGYLIDLLDTAQYRAAAFDTEWLDRSPELRVGSDAYAVEALVAAAILYYQRVRDVARRAFFANPTSLSPASIPSSNGQRIDLSRGGESYRLEIFAVGAWRYRVHLDQRVTTVKLRNKGVHRASLEIGERSLRVLHDLSDRGVRVEIEAHPYRFSSELAGQVRAGTPAMVISLDVAVGDAVEIGQTLGLLEAMKMEIGFQAEVAGVVKEIAVRSGQQVAAGDLLLVIDVTDEDGNGGEAAATTRLELPLGPDPLDLFFRPADDAGAAVPDLVAADAAPPDQRRLAIDAARGEVRRLVMGYDLNPERGEKLAAFLEAPLPDDLSQAFRRDLAEIRHELSLFSDIEQLFIRAPGSSPAGEPVPSNYAQLRSYVRRLGQGGEGQTPEFVALLRAALPHYQASGLEYGDGLERAILRILASQLAPEIRHRLVLASLRRIHALAQSGLHLGDDSRLADALVRIAGMRGLLKDAIADLAIETGYAIFEAPEIERQAERTNKNVDAWLAAAESEVTPPPTDVLTHLVNAPLSVFHRVGRWLDDADPRRRAVSVAAYVRRLYATRQPSSHTSGVIGGVLVERLDLVDGRIILGSVTHADAIAPTFERLLRAAHAAVRSATVNREAPADGVHAIELLIPVSGGWNFEQLRALAAPFLSDDLPARRLTLSAVEPDGRTSHLSFVAGDLGLREQGELHGLHPETAARIGLGRLECFELERLEAPDDIFCFHLNSQDTSGDERLFVLADVRGRSPDAGSEMTLHLAAFERAFFDAARTLRNTLGLRDPRRRLQWNRIALFVTPPLLLDADAVQRLTRRLYPATRNLGLEKVIVRLNVLERDSPELPARPVEIVIADPTGNHMEMSWRTPHHEPLQPAQMYERKVVAARRRRLVYPYEIIRMLEGGAAGTDNSRPGGDLPPGRFEEFELAAADGPPAAVSVAGRKPGQNPSAVVFGIIDTATSKHPEGMRRVLILSDPTIGMGSLAAPECDRIIAAIDLAESERIPVEWVPVSSGARIAMDSGTENLDATARVVRRIVTFTQAGGAIHILVQGVNVGAQSYFNALATMLQHTRGVLIMTPGASMVLTGRAALEASGSVSAEDEAAIGGFERVMGPNGEAQYYAGNLVAGYELLYDHYRYSYVAPGEAGPRTGRTRDPVDRDVTAFRCERGDGHDFDTIGEIFDERNAERKRPFAMRQLMAAVVDSDGGQLERWRSWQGAETAIVWDAHLGGHPVCLLGIESRNLPRAGEHDADGPAVWTGGTLFPQSSKKVARALNAASGNRPTVILANLSGFDGSPESMRKLQLEYGAEIARAVVNFAGPLLFLVVSRYHGGAYVVFSGALNEGLRPAALEGSFASVIGGGPAAAVVFSREVRARASTDPRVVELRNRAQRHADTHSREAFDATWADVLLEKQSEVAAEFDAIHSVERARDVGSLETLIRPDQLRPYLIAQLRRDE